MASFNITPLTARTGVEVIGLDFTQPIDTDTGAHLRRAFAEHHVLVMRDQRFTADQFETAAQVFGEIQLHDKRERHVPGHPGISARSMSGPIARRRRVSGTARKARTTAASNCVPAQRAISSRALAAEDGSL